MRIGRHGKCLSLPEWEKAEEISNVLHFLQFFSIEISKTKNLCEFTDIVWSSSGSEFSDEESDIVASDFLSVKMKKYRKYAMISKKVCNKEPELIEWKNDSDYEHDEQCSESKGNEVLLDILDPDSCPNSTFKADGEKEDEPSK
ncbi:hypothetical protein Chor_002896, partial [Crotalus horridus]